jgi:glycolate oxidase
MAEATVQKANSPYRPVTPAIVDELKSIVGEPYVIFGDAERMVDYAHDEVPGDEYAHMPEAVVRVATAQEISQVLKLANREMIPVTPRGAGSGLSGGAVAVCGGIVMATDRMHRILEIDRSNMVAVVEPGVVTNDINEAIKEFGLYYAGYPMSSETCFVGGNIAENAGGGRAIKYGVTSRYVLGLEVVLPTGEIVAMGGKRVKDVTGYDMVHLMVGSEGTLGVVTKVILKLLPLPAARVVVLVPFPDVECAIGVVPLMAQNQIVPSAIEFMDALTVKTIYAYVGETPPAKNIGALLLIEVDAFSAEQAEAEYNRIIDLCLEHGALDAFVGDTPAKQKKMWKPRQSTADAFKMYSPVQSIEDVVVPTAQIPRLVAEVGELAEKYHLLIASYGHAGDGNLHATPIKPAEMPMAEWHAMLPHLLEELYLIVAKLGGTISGEHGIGHKRRRYLSLVMDPVMIALQKRIKTAFDPNQILNPGKIFPE